MCVVINGRAFLLSACNIIKSLLLRHSLCLVNKIVCLFRWAFKFEFYQAQFLSSPKTLLHSRCNLCSCKSILKSAVIYKPHWTNLLIQFYWNFVIQKKKSYFSTFMSCTHERISFFICPQWTTNKKPPTTKHSHIYS